MSVPPSTYNLLGLRSTGCGGGGSTTLRILSTLLIALEIVGWDVPKILANACCLRFSCRKLIQLLGKHGSVGGW